MLSPYEAHESKRYPQVHNAEQPSRQSFGYAHYPELAGADPQSYPQEHVYLMSHDHTPLSQLAVFPAMVPEKQWRIDRGMDVVGVRQHKISILYMMPCPRD